jgi:hypothetical protein
MDDGSTGYSSAHLEVVTIDLICEACGESNPPGTEFCTNCNNYLAWDRSTPVRPVRNAATPLTQTPPPSTATGSYPAPAGPANDWTTEAPTAGYPEGGYAPQESDDQGSYDTGYYDDEAASTSSENAPPAQTGYEDLTCPDCGRVNPGTRRFCSRCGYAFFSSDEPGPYYDTGSSWAMSEAARDRAARREYRRSLPPLYRWRRGLIALLVVALGTAGVVIVDESPIRIAKDGWYRLNKAYVKVAPIQATVVPAERTAAGSDPANLVDGTQKEWTMSWSPAQDSSCGPAAGTGEIVLTFAPTRIRRIQIMPGLDEHNPLRGRQPLPKTLAVSFPQGKCTTITLDTQPRQRAVNFDSQEPVTELRIGISSAQSGGADALPLISITEIILTAYPS